MKRILLLLAAAALAGLVPSCASAPGESEVSEREARQHLDAELDRSLRPMVDEVSARSGARRVGFPGFYHGPSGRDVPMSRYLTPRVVRGLGERRVAVVERSDIDKLLDEQALLTSDLFHPAARERIGQLSGADLLLLCPAVSPAGFEYQVDWKLVDVTTGEILASGLVLIDRRHLPVRYGGAIE
jgi:hypothetical protein